MFPKRFQLIVIALVAMGLAMFTSIPARAASIGDVFGPYLYVNLDSGMCINDPHSSTGNNVTMIVYTCQGTSSASNERWDNEVRGVTTSDFWTFNESSRKCLTVLNASTAINQPIIQYSCSNGGNERWAYDAYHCSTACIFGDETFGGVLYHFVGAYRIRSLNGGKCITIKNASRASGASLLTYTCAAPTSEDVWKQFTKA